MTNPGPPRCSPGIDRAPTRANTEVMTRRLSNAPRGDLDGGRFVVQTRCGGRPDRTNSGRPPAIGQRGATPCGSQRTPFRRPVSQLASPNLGRIVPTFEAAGSVYQPPPRMRGRLTRRDDKLVSALIVAYCCGALWLATSYAIPAPPSLTVSRASLRRIVPSFTVEVRRRPRLATNSSQGVQSLEAKTQASNLNKSLIA